MKIITNIIGTASLAALVCVGCKQSETVEEDMVAPADPAVEELSIEEVSAEGGSTIKETVTETVTETTETAKEAISDANAQVQDLLTQAKKLVSEKKYAEATSLLQKVAGMELSPAQQTMLDNLKGTIQKSAESGAVEQGTKAIGNVLGGEK